MKTLKVVAGAAVLMGVFGILAFLFPLFARPVRGMEGRVVGANRRPIGGVRVTFRDGTSTITDRGGRFMFHPRSNTPISLSGLVFVRTAHRTGSYPIFDYARAVDYEFKIKGLPDTQDPLPDLVDVEVGSIDSHPHFTFGSSGLIVKGLPVGTELDHMKVSLLSDQLRLVSTSMHAIGSKVIVEIEVSEKGL